MPVRRFSEPDGMRASRWLPPGDARIGARLRSVLDAARRLQTVHRPAGVGRFRSVEGLNAARAAWCREDHARPGAASDPVSGD